MVDYIIVGAGLAGISFAQVALQHQKKIVVFENDSQNSSKIAGGLYNPVILKRFSEVWCAKEQLQEMHTFYEGLYQQFQIQLDTPMPIYRKFFSVEEQNNWFVAADKATLAPYLSTTLQYPSFEGIEAPHGYGEVLQSGYVDTAALLKLYRQYLFAEGFLQSNTFSYDDILFTTEGISYQGIQARHIIFAEGFGLHQNPFFNYLPLDGTKGELFIIKAPNLSIDCIVNTSIFLLPLGDHLFKVGATYNWKDKTDLPTAEGRLELIQRIQELIQCDFEIVEHLAGIRPTVRDRRPLVGTHSSHPQLHILNGLGTRGVMMGPALAKSLFLHIEEQVPLSKEMHWSRFLKQK